MKKIPLMAVLVALVSCTPEAENLPARSASTAVSTSISTDQRPTILFLGTSLTAGLGLSEDQAYPAILQARMDSAGYEYRVVNAGVSGETSAAGLRRVDWLLRAPVNVLVIELGANDGLRGQDVDAMKANIEQIIAKTRTAYPGVKVVVVGMEAPPNFGRVYTDAFRSVFPSIASELDVHLIPFLLEGVGGVESLNQADGIHPTAEGHRIVADNVWAVLEGVI